MSVLRISNIKFYIFMFLVCLPSLLLAQEKESEDELQEFLHQFHAAKTDHKKIAQFHEYKDSIKYLENTDTVSALLIELQKRANISKKSDLTFESIDALLSWYFVSVQFIKAIDFADSLLQYDMNLNKKDSFIIYDFLTLIYYHLEINDKCLVNVMIRDDLIKSMDNLTIEGIALPRMIELGSLYFMTGLYHQYINWTKNEIVGYSMTGKERWIPGGYNNIGLAWNKLLEPDSSIFYFNVAKKQVDKYLKGPKIEFLHQIDGNIGSALIMKGDYESAETLLLENINSIKQQEYTKDYINIVSSQLSLSECYLKKEKPLRAYKTLNSAWEKIQKMKYKQPFTRYFLLKSKVFNALEKYDSAYYYLSKYQNTVDSVQQLEKETSIISMQVAFDTKTKEHEIAQQKKQLENETTRVQKQKFILTITLLVLAFILFKLYVIFKSRKKTRQINQMLAEQNNKISAQAKHLEQLGSFKESMTNMLIHDLKNPLSNLVSLPVNLEDSRVEKIKQSGNRMLTIVMNLLDVNKYETSRMPLTKENWQGKSIADKAIARIAVLAHDKNIEIQNLLSSDIFILADMEILERVFENLLTNAIKYSPARSEISIRSLNVEKDQVKFIVTDKGEGVPEDYKEKIFDKYFQIDAKNAGRIRSSGLGLAFCKMAIEAHGGKIGVNSLPGKGAEFWFTIEKGKAGPDSDVEKAKEVNGAVMIYLSEEERTELQTISHQLRDIESYKVTTIRKILRQVGSNYSEDVLRWKKELLEAVNSGNKERYRELLFDGHSMVIK